MIPALCVSLCLACATEEEVPDEVAETGETSESGGTAEGTETGDPLEPPELGLCNSEPPDGAVLAPELPTYGGPGSCPILETGADALNVMETEHGPREFYLLAPSDLGAEEQLPILFMYHWLGGAAQTFINRGEVQAAVDEYRFIAIVPEGRDLDSGVPLRWPFSVGDDDDTREEEFDYHDDLIACAAEQFLVNKECISTTGVSAGGLFSGVLASRHGEHLASFMPISGGSGANEMIVLPWSPAPRQMPALVLWGGPTDLCLGVDFEATSQALQAGLEADGHFLLECVHNCAHSIPPFQPPGGLPILAPLVEFMLDHPFWLEPGTSPYQDYEAATGGLPPNVPSWCAIGAGNASIREGMCGPSEC